MFSLNSLKKFRRSISKTLLGVMILGVAEYLTPGTLSVIMSGIYSVAVSFAAVTIFSFPIVAAEKLYYAYNGNSKIALLPLLIGVGCAVLTLHPSAFSAGLALGLANFSLIVLISMAIFFAFVKPMQNKTFGLSVEFAAPLQILTYFANPVRNMVTALVAGFASLPIISQILTVILAFLPAELVPVVSVIGTFAALTTSIYMLNTAHNAWLQLLNSAYWLEYSSKLHNWITNNNTSQPGNTTYLAHTSTPKGYTPLSGAAGAGQRTDNTTTSSTPSQPSMRTVHG